VVVAEAIQPVKGTMQIPEHDRDEYGRPRLGGAPIGAAARPGPGVDLPGAGWLPSVAG
jgi:hypothetical protein